MGLALAVAVPAASALDLPVKRINGKDYYYYMVQRNESLLSIAEKLGVTRDDILRNNPGASDGVRNGMRLYLPVEEFAETDKSKAGVSASGETLRYKVQKGETLFGIAYRFDITPDAIVALNPGANGGVSAGDILLIPAKGVDAEKLADNSIAQEVAPAAEVTEITTATTPVEESVPETTVVETTAEGAAEEPVRASENIEIVEVVDDSTEVEKSTIAVLLPLMLEKGHQDKMARSASDFVRGFMLGINTMSENSVPVDLKVYDTNNSPEEIRAILGKPELQDVDVIISPEEAGAVKLVLDATTSSGAYVLNLFSAQDTSYLESPRAIQTYIPAALMYEKAAQALIDMYDDYTPVFLISKGGRSEKLPFTNYLREQFAASGVVPVELVFDSMLSSDDLQSLDREGKYVFIPASGSLTEFNKFSRALVNLRDEYADPTAIALFGYPDWTTFLGESAERLHQLGATIYSRFYCDETSLATHQFMTKFFEQYGVKPIEQQVPSQAMLGYDAARFLLTNLKANAGIFTPEDKEPFKGLQSTFMFVTADEEPGNDDVRTTGPVNQALYIIKFMPGEQVSVQVL